MEKDPQRLNLEGLVRKLRSVTLAVQLLPFVYGFFFVLAMVAYLVLPEWVSVVCDHMFYVSLVVIIYNLILSRTLRLCGWHKAACVVPLFPELVSVADQTVIELSEDAAVINIWTIATMTFVLLVSAYKVFFSNGRK